jgi:hypothetical protein
LTQRLKIENERERKERKFSCGKSMKMKIGNKFSSSSFSLCVCVAQTMARKILLGSEREGKRNRERSEQDASEKKES